VDLGLRNWADPDCCDRNDFHLDWVIVGCESGPGRRPCSLDDVRFVVDDCRVAGIPVFVKQLEIDGRIEKDPARWPEDLRIQEFPRT
jgi:protein gp37